MALTTHSSVAGCWVTGQTPTQKKNKGFDVHLVTKDIFRRQTYKGTNIGNDIDWQEGVMKTKAVGCIIVYVPFVPCMVVL